MTRPAVSTRMSAIASRLGFYVDGRWIRPATAQSLDGIDRLREEPFARIRAGSAWGDFGFEEFLEVKAVMGCPETRA